jgi:hypothetical protein
MSENESAAAQICRRLMKMGIECEEISPGNFSILYGECSLMYYGNGSWIFRYPSNNSWRFISKSTSCIALQVEEYVNKYLELLQHHNIHNLDYLDN